MEQIEIVASSSKDFKFIFLIEILLFLNIGENTQTPFW